MSEWKIVKLGDVVTFQRGYDLPKTKMIEGIYPVIGSNGIIGYHNEFTTNSPSITIGRSGNVGKPFIYKGKSWSHNTTLFVKEFKNVYPSFIYYLLGTLNLNHYAGGTAVPTLNRNHIHNLEINLPPLETQKKIAAVLSALDDKIELNNAINRNLEAQAQAIFDEFYNSSLPTKKLLSIADVRYGKNLPTKKLCKKGYRVFGGNGIIGRYTEYLYEKPMIIVSCRGAASGKVIITYPYSFVTNNSLVIELKDYRYYEFLKRFFLENQFFLYATGSAQPQITIESLKKILVPYPDFVLIEEITNTFKSYSDMIYNNKLENETLGEIRDALLPRLMSGEIDVSEVEI